MKKIKLAEDWSFYDEPKESERERLQSCVLSCLVNEPEKTFLILEEFGIKVEDFQPIGIRQMYARLENGELDTSDKVAYTPIEYMALYFRNYLPSSENARYYVEEFYQLLQKEKSSSAESRRGSE